MASLGIQLSFVQSATEYEGSQTLYTCILQKLKVRFIPTFKVSNIPNQRVLVLESGRQKYLISCTAKQGKPSFPTKPGHGTSHNGQDPECLPSIQIVSSENNAASPANSSEDAPGKSRRYTQYLLNFVLMGFRRPERPVVSLSSKLYF